MERPGFNKSVRRKLAALVAQDIKQQCSIGNDIDEIKDDCYSTLNAGYICSEGGYELAKRLEYDHAYSPDFNMVEALDQVSSHYDDLLEQQYKEWVLAYDIKLEHTVGTKVRVSGMGEEGEITKLYPEVAKYGVWTEKLGLDQKGKSSYVVHHERVTAMDSITLTQ